MESIVISIGGSVLFSDEINEDFFIQLDQLLQKQITKYRIYLIIGGGKKARKLIHQGREQGLPEEKLDEIGIKVTRENAKKITMKIKNSNKIIPESTNQAKNLDEKIVIMGGTTPGHSTDMVGAELAEKTNALKFIIATNVDGVYDKDPNKYPDAIQIKEITIKNLIYEYGTDWRTAGRNVVIDGPALKIIEKAKIPTYVLNGKKLEELEKALNNEQFNGTIIKI
ncbi:MAG: UMP kinase [Thermoplasmatales archaeon]|nr:MAG: UMP kinase [Thermoplasmatales archaeon]